MNLLVVSIFLAVLSALLSIFHESNKDKIGDEDFTPMFWFLVLYSKVLSFVLNVIVLILVVFLIYTRLIIE